MPTVSVVLPIDVSMDMETSAEMVGATVRFRERGVVIETELINSIDTLRNQIQYKEGVPQDTVDVGILDPTGFRELLESTFRVNLFRTSTSEDLYFFDHVSEELSAQLTRVLGLNAASSYVQIQPNEASLSGVANALVTALLESYTLRGLLYEQYFLQSPDRFEGPGDDAVYKPIPFESGDSLAFSLSIGFQSATINNTSVRLSSLLPPTFEPMIRFTVVLNLQS
jgi:hypothetical protein